MRIWSLHPKYLDTKGLVALWREALLAKNVLKGNTNGYRNHPQLIRFKEFNNPIKHIHYYLQVIWEEARKRNYNFNQDKFIVEKNIDKIPVKKGQLQYEFLFLLGKLKNRDIERYKAYKDIIKADIHPLFYLTEGEIEHWEKNIYGF